MKDIFKKYENKINKDIKHLIFLYNGNLINENLKLEQINKENNEIIILVEELNNKNNYQEKIIESKDIICPHCGENCIINFNEYKISLSKCDNMHKIENIRLNEFQNLQKINESKIICNICNAKKAEVFDNKFFKCFNCNLNLCPLCKLKHIKEHIIIDYELKNYLCKNHGEKYISYCKDCNKNLCDLCGFDHNKNHVLIYHRDIIQNKNDNNNILREKIKKIKEEIKEMINKLKIIENNLEVYNNICNNIINKNLKNKNYQILVNINEISIFNNLIIFDLDKIINENKIENKIKYLYEMYEKMENKNNDKKEDKNEIIKELNKEINIKENENERKNGKKEDKIKIQNSDGKKEENKKEENKKEEEKKEENKKEENKKEEIKKEEIKKVKKEDSKKEKEKKDKNEFTEEELKKWKEIFNLFDENKNGSISTKIIGDSLRALGYNPSNDEIKKIINEIDKERKGKIRLNEFLSIKKLIDKDDPQELIESFQIFDKEGKGFITLEDFKKILTFQTGEEITNEEVNDQLDSFKEAIDKNGLVNYYKVVDLMLNN